MAPPRLDAGHRLPELLPAPTMLAAATMLATKPTCHCAVLHYVMARRATLYP